MTNNDYIFLGSGILGFKALENLKNLHLTLSHVYTDKNSDEIIKYCVNSNIAYDIVNINKVFDYNAVNNSKLFLMISVNYKFIVDSKIIKSFKHPINFHGSLLPKYRGRTPHVWAIINGEKETGITCHYMTENVDDGDIIDQIKVTILPEDTGQKIYDKFLGIYPNFVKKTVQKIMSGNFSARKQDEKKATYYGKRTPIMGYIDFHKNAVDIINFVRAIAQPYPGAYCYLANSKKIIVNEVKITNINCHNVDIGKPFFLDEKMYVRCKDAILELTKFNIEEVPFA